MHTNLPTSPMHGPKRSGTITGSVLGSSRRKQLSEEGSSASPAMSRMCAERSRTWPHASISPGRSSPRVPTRTSFTSRSDIACPEKPTARTRRAPDPCCCGSNWLEREADLRLDRPHVLGARDRAETGARRLQAARIDRSVRQVLRVADRLVLRADELQLRHAAVEDHRVERVVHLDAQLDVAALAEPDVARDRKVRRVIGAADHVVAPGLEPDAAGQRAG